VNITQHNGRFTKSFKIDLQDRSLGELQVRTSKRMTEKGWKWETPEINWPSCGFLAVAEASMFLQALQIAILLADSFTQGLNNNAIEERLRRKKLNVSFTPDLNSQV